MALFRAYLITAWEAAVSLVDGDSSLLDDWKQASWENLVESRILEPGSYLAVYGDGSDCNGASSRVWKPEAPATHEVYCEAMGKGSAVDLLNGGDFDPSSCVLDRFVTWNGSIFSEEPPFDHVLLLRKDGSVLLVAEAAVSFRLRALV